ncbi:Flp pilus assembly protein CpaB [Cellulomonas flavigena DSM 20109]|uniref:Flp pilus assembly protein CpaB n=1 Tax=Cellulomonas flavigena (strain ATCC 482 / DSM 20109 / BCRC 11376 / JCM 18109 / NBRC 3775 / NCIMB 8073 / NRS 134) TaxID=446466 RepID=D5UIB3_CELFN|nr:Flp pilus assembly protein CpaB [Cellulomonas flavigena]ADG75458.1 Flp pilus assembly protein CpaB [Cellulomonas flavigena DSM 20109]
MNPRQRRGVLFVLLSVVFAVVVFFVIASYVGNVASQVGSLRTVYRLADDTPAFAELQEGDLVADEVPARWLSPSAEVTLDELVGRKVATNLLAGTMVTSDLLVPPSDLSTTEREIAISVNQVTGVADRVRPGDRVDIYAVFADVPGLAKQVRVLVRDVRVVSVRGSQVVLDESAASGTQSVVPVTLALEPDDALAVTYAAAFAQEVRLVGLPAGLSDRTGEEDEFDAENLGGQAVPEGVDN